MEKQRKTNRYILYMSNIGFYSFSQLLHSIHYIVCNMDHNILVKTPHKMR